MKHVQLFEEFVNERTFKTLPLHSREFAKKMGVQWIPDTEDPEVYKLKSKSGHEIVYDLNTGNGQYIATDRKGKEVYRGNDPYELKKIVEQETI
jgi:hypothetical protein